MPFGLCNAPTFQTLMQKDQSGLGGQNPFYGMSIDNIVVFVYETKQSWFEPASREASVRTAMSAILGYNVSLEGISPNPEKMETVTWFPVPTLVNRVSQFLSD